MATDYSQGAGMKSYSMMPKMQPKKKLKVKKESTPMRDLLTGRALVEGIKVIGRGMTANIRRTERRHQQITNSKGR